jgi:hypothetical protein
MAGGRRASMIIVLGMGHIPKQRKKEKGGANQAIIHILTPYVCRNKERADKIVIWIVSSDNVGL